MKNPLARFRQAGSFTAGLLIGVSIMIPMFAMLLTNLGDWQMAWIVGALIVLALGLKLQSLLTRKPRHPRKIALAVGVLPVGFMEPQLER
jgi:hypothetical protein